MSVVPGSEVNRPSSSQIHPGWLARPRSSVEMLALKLGVTVPRLIQHFGESLNSLIEETLAHGRERETQRYLKFLQEREERERAAAAAERESELESALSLIPDEDWQSVSLRSICNRGGFKAFLNWFNTDNWGSDEWFCLAQVSEPEDVRVRRWMDSLLSATLDGTESDSYIYLDADYFGPSDTEPDFID